MHTLHSLQDVMVCVFVCVKDRRKCMCVCERERNRQRKKGLKELKEMKLNTQVKIVIMNTM